ncbi:hypothetical protein ACTA71_001045 [Dictyostelium dimigraforme]
MSNFFKKLVKKDGTPKGSRKSKSQRADTPSGKYDMNGQQVVPDTSSNLSDDSSSQSDTYDKRGEPNMGEQCDTLDDYNFGNEISDAESAPEDKKSLWKKVGGLVGKDPMSLVSLPVYFFEPLTVLECQLEPLRFVELIEKAASCSDSMDRLMYLTAFNIAVFSSYTRTAKPFNPLLGETFEYIDTRGRYKSFCEQVSHHPPIGIAQTTSDIFDLQQESWITTKFWGNSLDVFSHGQNHLYLNATGEHFTWKVPSAICHNIIFGKMWIEHYGDLIVENHNTGEKAIINFQKSGWFEGTQRKVQGEILDSRGNARVLVNGKWDKYVKVKKLSDGPSRKSSGEITIWEATIEPPEDFNKWKHGKWIQGLNEMSKEYQAVLPSTDSRVRMDRIYLEKEENKLANKEKNKIEEREREKRKSRESKKEVWKPNYFSKREDSKYGYRWDFNGKYWDERDKRVDTIVDKFKNDPNFDANKIPEYDDSKLNISVKSLRKFSRDLTNSSTPTQLKRSFSKLKLEEQPQSQSQSLPPMIKEDLSSSSVDHEETFYNESNEAKLESIKEDANSHTYIYSSPSIGHSGR